MRFTGLILVLVMLSACAKQGAVSQPVSGVAATNQCCVSETCTKTQYTDTDSGITYSCFSPQTDPAKCQICLRAGG